MICLVGEFCHFFTTRMFDCLNCIPIIACSNVNIVLVQTQWLWFHQTPVNNFIILRKCLPVKCKSLLFCLVTALLLLKNHLMTEKWPFSHNFYSNKSLRFVTNSINNSFPMVCSKLFPWKRSFVILTEIEITMNL